MTHSRRSWRSVRTGRSCSLAGPVFPYILPHDPLLRPQRGDTRDCQQGRQREALKGGRPRAGRSTPHP
jgi:hypothetical protein